LQEGRVGDHFKPGSANMANVAHFMREVATDPGVWDDWKGKLPVLVSAGPSAR
jgi:hypothetical protein